VRLAFGTDAGVYPHGMNAIQFGHLVRLGMSPLAAIRSATLEAAELMGWSRDVGALAPGRFADFLAVDGDPTADVELLRSPVVVAKGGIVVRDERSGQATADGT
jgi:imidazolonepropionase-like amidohydrolase